MRPPKKGNKGGHRPPEGKVRLGQIVMTFGPGAMVDLLDHAVLIGGTDFWRYDKYKDQGFIDEPRLRDTIVAKIGSRLGFELAAARAFRLPPAGDDDAPSQHNGIQVAEFPAWFVCQRCRALGPSKNLEREKGRYVHHCTNKQKGVCIPVRFVTTCKRGHLDEFPWNWFVHVSPEKRCDPPDLYLQEDASGDFSHISVECRACGSTRKLSEARESELLPLCRGDRPWLGFEGREEKGCDDHLQLLVRTASSSYFAQWMSALTIPDKTRELMDKIIPGARSRVLLATAACSWPSRLVSVSIVISTEPSLCPQWGTTRTSPSFGIVRERRRSLRDHQSGPASAPGGDRSWRGSRSGHRDDSPGARPRSLGGGARAALSTWCPGSACAGRRGPRGEDPSPVTGPCPRLDRR